MTKILHTLCVEILARIKFSGITLKLSIYNYLAKLNFGDFKDLFSKSHFHQVGYIVNGK